MKVDKRHAPTVFLLVMVTCMVVVMTVTLALANGAIEKGFWSVWPRQFAIAYAVAIPVAFVARKVANVVVAKVTE